MCKVCRKIIECAMHTTEHSKIWEGYEKMNSKQVRANFSPRSMVASTIMINNCDVLWSETQVCQASVI